MSNEATVGQGDCQRSLGNLQLTAGLEVTSAFAAVVVGGTSFAARGLPAATMIATPGGVTIRSGVSAIELLMPNGARIGQSGASASIRVIQGGATEAQVLFEQLARSGIAFTGPYRGAAVSLPGGGFVGLRSVATATGARAAPAVTIDVNIPGIAIRELKFVP